MGKPKGELPEAVGRVRTEIETWRQVRKKRSPMPARLWEAAASLAESHGVYQISRALRLSYESLKNRVKSASQGDAVSRSEVSGFVELGGVGLIHPGSGPSVEMEMSKADGSRLSIRFSGVPNVDISSMVESFWGRGH